MSTVDEKKKTTKMSKGKTPTTEEIYNGFQLLRAQQRKLVHTLADVETDLNEHKMVLESLKDLDGDRKCFRLIGGILCEKTVKEVVPMLMSNKEQLTEVVETLNKQVTKKGEEINEYKEKNNIKIRSQMDIPSSNEEGESKPNDTQPRHNIMVNPI